ncbi:hypothetical protein Lser_V15G14415 [Lactuca serriola]
MIYYKCDSTSDCIAKRRVERNSSDPNSIILKYTGHHNHPMPMFMKYAVKPTSSKNIILDVTESLMKSKKNDDDIFEGLGNFVNL